MARAGSVTIRIDGDDSGYRKTLAGLGSATKLAVRGIATAGGILSAAWSAVGLTSVKYNAEIEQLETSFKTMTGSADKAASVMERLRKLGAKTPFATKDLASATQLLMQYGMDADVAIDRMEMLGDIAQGNTEKMMRIATAYGQMTSAGKVQLQDIKQMIEAGFNPLQEITEKTGESTASLYDRISKGTLAVNEITDAMRSATSEGGRFFGAMAAQSETVQGLLSTLKDELLTLGGDLFKPVSESLRTDLLPEAIRLVQAMQDAYGKGGMDGLIDSVTNEIPRLIDAASGALEKIAAKLKDKLPGIFKKLISALPSLLTSAGDSLLPTIVDTIFEIIAVATEEVTARLPELIPALVRGIGNLLKSVFSGIWNVTSSLSDGIETALKKMGVLGLTPIEAFEEAWDNVDTSQYKDFEVTVGLTITPEEYESKIDAALEEVRTALNNIPGLTEDQKTNIENAIINGTGVELLNDTLANLPLPTGAAESVTAAITDAINTIDTTLTGLGLSDGAIANIKSVAEAGGNVAEAIEAYGVDSEIATAAAGDIETSMASIETAVSGIGLDGATQTAILAGALSDKKAVEAALLLLKVEGEDIKPVLDSYDTISGSITAGAKSVFKQIADEYTNGVPESDADIQAAKTAVEGLFRQSYELVDQWKTQAVTDLEASGLTGAALESAITAVETDAQGMINELNRLEQEAMAWTEENANKSTAFVEGNLDQLDNIVARLSDINAQIDVLTNEQFNTARSRRSLVQAGAVTDVESQIEAFAITSEELKQRIQEAKTTAGEALDKAVEDFAGDAEGYAAREKEILDQLAQDKENAYSLYNSEVEQLISGIMKASPEMSAALEEYASEQETAQIATQLRDYVANAISKAAASGAVVPVDQFWDAIELSGLDMSSLAEKLGLEPEELTTSITNALKSGSIDGQFNDAVNGYVDTINADFATALQEGGVDLSAAIPAIKEAISRGYLTATTGIDWTSMESVLSTMLGTTMGEAATGLEDAQDSINTSAETAVSKVPSVMDVSSKTRASGVNAGKGYAQGMLSQLSTVRAAGAVLAKAATSSLAAAQQEGSPSKITRRSGRYFGQGFALGISDELETAKQAAMQMANAAIGSLDSIGGRISVSQQANAGGMASAFRNMLAGLNLATDSETPVQLYINGRLVAESMRRDVRTTQAGYNTAIAKGVGKA